MTDKCSVFAGGDRVSSETLDMEHISFSYVIAADRGYLLAESLGIKCDLYIGDFDSSKQPSHGNVQTYPIEKDDTDLMLALRAGLERGCKSFQLYGAFGGSADHLFANIQTLAYLCENGAEGVLIGDKDTARIISPGLVKIKKRKGRSLSLFAFSEKVTGLTISGAKYNADNITLENNFPLGVSNSVISENGAEISFKTGRLLIIESERG
ncbi:MAG: thiamine diphosphokinase [Ruminococcus sp.]|nr:thiamine diphosphokinase [Ruminococcus sp.]